MRYILLILTWLTIYSVYSQNTINGTITGLVNEDLYLIKIAGDNRKIVDTATTDMTGSFVMELDREFNNGMYAVIVGPNQAIELVYNQENIRFITSGNTVDAQVQIIESIENLIYYDYLALKGANLYKLDLLEPLLLSYPKDDAFYVETLVNAKHLQKQLTDRTKQLIEENPTTLSSHFILADLPVFAQPELDFSLKKEYLKTHYFDNIDFTDTLLMQSNILTSKIVQYLSLFQEQGMTQEALETKLLVAVDTVLNKASINQAVSEYIIDFLIGGFEAIGFERGLEHIANQNILSEMCVNTERKAELENKMELIRKLAIGQIAPDFETMDMAGKSIRLSSITSKKTVLFFWASWCPHCEDMIPILKEAYNASNTDQIEIIGISIDKIKDDLENAIIEHDLKWINIGELQGWDGPIIDKYGIVATPTIFMLDESKQIIAKPRNIKELKNSLK